MMALFLARASIEDKTDRYWNPQRGLLPTYDTVNFYPKGLKKDVNHQPGLPIILVTLLVLNLLNSNFLF